MEVFIGANDRINPAQFLDLVHRLYRTHPLIVKTKSEEFLSTIDPLNPAHNFGALTHIAIRNANSVCAHASVVEDERKKGALLVGHIECKENDAVIALLFAKIENVARRRGVRSIVLPVDRSLWRTFRAPVSGNGAPFFTEPYFPNYVGDAFLQHGYRVIQESESLLGQIPELGSFPAGTNEVVCARIAGEKIRFALPGIFKIASVSFRDTPYFFPISFEEFCFPLAHHSSSMERALLFVAKSEGKIVGFLLGYRSPEACPPGVVAKTMAILPEFRRIGVGRSLFRLFYAHALAEGFKNVYYSTMEKNNSTIHALISAGGLTARQTRAYGLFEKTL